MEEVPEWVVREFMDDDDDMAVMQLILDGHEISDSSSSDEEPERIGPGGSVRVRVCGRCGDT